MQKGYLRRCGFFVLLILCLGVGQSVFAAKKVTVKKPTGLKVKDYDKNYVKLTWNKVSKATGYVVYRYTAYSKRYTKFWRRDGVDCSGYVGWSIYNIMNTKSGNNGYVMFAQDMAKNYSSRGWGKFTKRSKVKTYKPGDIMSSDCSCCRHVYIVIGQCEDGSLVVLHSTASGGVQLSGTVTPGGKKKSQAVTLAKQYMSKYFPGWCEKFDVMTKGTSYLEHYCQMSWDVTGTTIMTDPEGYQNMTAEEVLLRLFRPAI